MLADADSAFDEEIQVLGNVGFQSNGFHNSKDFVSVHKSHLSDSVTVSEDDTCKKRNFMRSSWLFERSSRLTNLRWCHSLLPELLDLFLDIFRVQFEP